MLQTQKDAILADILDGAEDAIEARLAKFHKLVAYAETIEHLTAQDKQKTDAITSADLTITGLQKCIISYRGYLYKILFRLIDYGAENENTDGAGKLFDTLAIIKDLIQATHSDLQTDWEIPF